MDTGDYRNALEAGVMDRDPMFTRFKGDSVVWPNGGREPIDAVIYATGYRPDLSPTFSHSARSTPAAPSTPTGSPQRIPASPMWAWSSNARSPPTPSAASTRTPSTSQHPWPRSSAMRPPPWAYDQAA